MKLKVKEIVPDFVAELNEFPFQAIDDEVVAELRAVWSQYPVIRFRNVEINDAQQVAFTKALGPIHFTQDLRRGILEDFPEIVAISNKEGGDLGDGEVVWHTDQWYLEEPCSGAILRALEVPPEGGNTYFADMYAAYSTLPEAMKARVKNLDIHQQRVISTLNEVRIGETIPASSDYNSWPGVDHPIVRKHLVSGKPCLYLGAHGYQAIVGMDQETADELLETLWQHATNEAFVWCQEWKVGDMLLWDNRCLMHRRDPFDGKSIRHMHRTTVKGERPVAAY